MQPVLGRFAMVAFIVFASATALAEPQAENRSYRRIDVPSLGVTALVPNGWRYIANQGKLLTSFAVVKTNTRSMLDQAVDIGLTVYAVDRLGRLGGGTLGQRVAAFAQLSAAAPGHRLLTQTPLTRGRYQGIALRYHDANERPSRTVYREYLADEAADRLLIVTFQSATRDWRKAWAVGQTLVRALLPECDKQLRYQPTVTAVISSDPRC